MRRKEVGTQERKVNANTEPRPSRFKTEFIFIFHVHNAHASIDHSAVLTQTALRDTKLESLDFT